MDRIFAPSVSVILLGSGLALLIVQGSASGKVSSNRPFDIGVGAVLTLAGLGFILPAFRPLLVLTTHTLRRPRVLRRSQITPLDQITGVGLVYRRRVRDPAPGGWSLCLWTTGDILLDLGIYCQLSFSWRYTPEMVRQKFLAVEPSAAELHKPFDRYRYSFNFDPVTQTDLSKIAATYPGHVAREIYDRVLAYQGPTGLLAMRQDQKHVPVPDDIPWLLQTAYWSPDGELGHATSTPKPRWQVPASPPARPRRPGLMVRLQYGVRLAGRKFQRRGRDVRDIF